MGEFLTDCNLNNKKHDVNNKENQDRSLFDFQSILPVIIIIIFIIIFMRRQ